VAAREEVDVREWVLEFVVALDAEHEQAPEGQAPEEAEEEHLEAAGSEVEAVAVVDAVAGGYQNEEGAEEVGEYEVCEEAVGFVAVVEAAQFEQGERECEVDDEAYYDVDAADDGQIDLRALDCLGGLCHGLVKVSLNNVRIVWVDCAMV